MFPSPPTTLTHSLSNVLTDAQQYHPDVCFVFENEQQLWAHRALLIARVPEESVLKLMPQLLDDNNTNDALIIPDLSTRIPYSVFVNLLWFWYTADFSPETQSSSRTSSTMSSSTTSMNSPTERVCPLASGAETISALEHKLHLQLLPRTTQGLSDSEQLVADLACMRRNQLNCDITVNIFRPSIVTSTSTPKKKKQAPKPTPPPTLIKRHTTPANSDTIVSILNTTPLKPTINDDDDDETDNPANESAAMISFPVHRCILGSRSSYFHSLFYDGQQSSDTPSSSTVLLPSDIFSSLTLDIILHYFYTDQLQIPDLPPPTTTSSNMSVFQKEMNRKKHRLRELQKVYRAADYLGLTDSLCKATLHEMESICHRFQCTCSSCVVLLPSMMAFANKRPHLPLLRSILMGMYTDPLQAFPSLWSQKPFALLIMAHLAPAEKGASITLLPASLQCLFNNNENDTPPSSIPSHPSSADLLVDLISTTLENITKRNAVHVLHSIHLCLSKIRSADPLPTWSQPSLSLIHAFLYHTLAMVTLDFNYYCVDYPILLSCVDGIGGGFSVDFLDFLLKRLLNDGIQDSNAAVLYQGIVRDLIGRQQVVKNVAVDGVLLDARRQCVEYLTHRWVGVKAQGGFRWIDKDILRLMAEDINVPYRTLSKPMESEFSAMFGFKSMTLSTGKKALDSTETVTDSGFKKTAFAKSGTEDTSKSRRRLSLNSLRRSSKNNMHRRSAAELDEWTDALIEDQRSLSDNDAISHHSFHRHLSLHQQHTNPTMIRTSSSVSLTDVLLPVDMTCSMTSTTSSPNYQHHRRGSKNDDVTVVATTTATRLTGKPPRKSRLTFELPETPIRAKLAIKTSGRTKHKYRWGGLKSGKESGSDSGDDMDDHLVAVVGAKVELLRRPLPTLGRIKYIGHVQFAKGTWVGVELESRLGQNDGSVDGVRYFQTDPQRGVFVKSDGLKLISTPLKS